MHTYVVYIDEILLGNFIINFAILWITGRLANLKISFWRLSAGAVLGALYSLVLFFSVPDYIFSVFVKMIFSFIMVAVVFAPLNASRFFITLGLFYIISFAFGGIVLGATYFLHSQGLSFNLSNFWAVTGKYLWQGIFLALVIIWAFGKWGPVLWRKKIVTSIFRIPLTVCIGEKVLQVDALLDTGNRLTDPLTGYPVIVIEYEAFKNLLPREMAKVFKETLKGSDFSGILNELSATGWAARFRVIPFRSVGRTSGILPGFRPDEVKINYDNNYIVVKKVIIGVYSQKLCSESKYQALLHPQLLAFAAAT